MTPRSPLVRSAFILGLAAAPLALGAQSTSSSSNPDFTWSGAIERGALVSVRNLNGAVLVEAATGSQVEITATKRARRGNPEEVRIEVKRVGTNGGDVVACAMWRASDRCEEDDRGRNTNWNSDDDDHNDVSVEFRVKLPAGVRLDASTVNGKVRVDGASAEVEVSSVNGSIEAASTSGPVRARTVNGSIDVRMTRLTGNESLDYSTVNGAVKVRIPEGLNADVELSTVNGSLESDFPLQLNGRLNRQHVRARLGTGGGARLSFKTVNGSVHLMRNN